eukprot:TRINITY_DN21224_c0_g1_i1.p1 TRINITY_DN21224_c0_g1~~TRINITY_DN21224_c0_g1_i1.p1  ORF type:complete len:462 (+),score=79.38 TRINITY_DN21224_c0_g1_i1:45-1430(+)
MARDTEYLRANEGRGDDTVHHEEGDMFTLNISNVDAACSMREIRAHMEHWGRVADVGLRDFVGTKATLKVGFRLRADAVRAGLACHNKKQLGTVWQVAFRFTLTQEQDAEHRAAKKRRRSTDEEAAPRKRLCPLVRAHEKAVKASRWEGRAQDACAPPTLPATSPHRRTSAELQATPLEATLAVPVPRTQKLVNAGDADEKAAPVVRAATPPCDDDADLLPDYESASCDDSPPLKAKPAGVGACPVQRPRKLLLPPVKSEKSEKSEPAEDSAAAPPARGFGALTAAERRAERVRTGALAEGRSRKPPTFAVPRPPPPGRLHPRLALMRPAPAAPTPTPTPAAAAPVPPAPMQMMAERPGTAGGDLHPAGAACEDGDWLGSDAGSDAVSEDLLAGATAAAVSAEEPVKVEKPGSAFCDEEVASAPPPPGRPPGRVACPVCGEMFKKRGLHIHIRRKHPLYVP